MTRKRLAAVAALFSIPEGAVSPTAAQVGSHFFECTVECGVGHPFSGRIDVVP